MPAVMWFRRDLRLADNPAWAEATRAHRDVTALFVVEPALWQRAGSKRRGLLRGHLRALDQALASMGGRLRIGAGKPSDVLAAVAGEVGADTVYCNRDYSPHATRRDARVAARVNLEQFAGLAVHAPGEIMTAAGSAPRVFTPYSKRWFDLPWGLWPQANPVNVADDPGEALPEEEPPLHEPGEVAAMARLADFTHRVDRYPHERDRPDIDATSRLSADLHFGVVDPRRVRFAVGESTPGRAAFVRQLCWRDFYLQVLWHHPESTHQALRHEYRGIPWRDDSAGFDAWTSGMTGYPIVDAGMRQLQREGFIHNRVRMLAASFLVKDLLIDWRWGERWFRRHLIDGDIAQNVGNWQWVAGTGTDAAPYFRIFNPVTQSRKFDPSGAYIKRFVPELAGLHSPAIHAPWEAGPLELVGAGVILGETYPDPIVDHPFARKRTLEVFAAAKAGNQ